jgi:hypothetical protein
MNVCQTVVRVVNNALLQSVSGDMKLREGASTLTISVTVHLFYSQLSANRNIRAKSISMGDSRFMPAHKRRVFWCTPRVKVIRRRGFQTVGRDPQVGHSRALSGSEQNAVPNLAHGLKWFGKRLILSS